MQINIEYDIKESDLIKSVYNHVKYSNIHRLKRTCALVIIFIFVMVAVNIPIFPRITYGVLICLISYFFYQFLNIFLVKKKTLSLKHLFLGTRLCTLSEKSIYISKQRKIPSDVIQNHNKKYFTKNEHNWNEIHYYIRDGSLFHIYFEKNRALLIKSDSSADDIELFLKNRSIKKRG